MRTANNSEKNFAKETKTKKSNTGKKKLFKPLSFVLALATATAIMVIPTTTLAPSVDAFEDSKAASASIGDIGAFSSAIEENCAIKVTVPATQAPTTVTEPTTAPATEKKAEKKQEKTEPATEKSTQKATEAPKKEKTESSSKNESYSDNSHSEPAEKVENTTSQNSQSNTGSSAGYLVDIANPDPSYSPRQVSLSSYDRAKLERLVMGEGGTMGYVGAALIAQSIRDAMNRSNTNSIDQIISEYQYFGSTAIQPNQDVKNAVSFIFDQNGSAVQHRVLCFYIGYSGWHETQNYITSCCGVRFFDLWY